MAENIPSVLVLILTWNASNVIEKCLVSLRKISKRGRFKHETLTIDNASSDNTVKIIENEEGVNFIKNEKNLGWGKAINLGVKEAQRKKFDWIFILNPDVYVPKNSLKVLLEFAERNRYAQILAPAVKFKKKGKTFYDLGGRLTFFGRTYHQNIKQLNSRLPQFPDYVSGAAMLVKLDLFKKIGLFKENYFLYFEDVDFCLRAKEKGFNVVVVPTALINHKLSSSIGFSSQKNIYYNLRNNLNFVRENFPPLKKIIAFGYLILLTIKIFINSFKNSRVLFLAWHDFFEKKLGPSTNYD